MWKQLENGTKIEVGDKIAWVNLFGKNVVTVTRVTENFSWGKNDYMSVEMKFPRIFDFYFQSYPKDRFKTATFLAYRKVETEE